MRRFFCKNDHLLTVEQVGHSQGHDDKRLQVVCKEEVAAGQVVKLTCLQFECRNRKAYGYCQELRR